MDGFDDDDEYGFLDEDPLLAQAITSCEQAIITNSTLPRASPHRTNIVHSLKPPLKNTRPAYIQPASTNTVKLAAGAKRQTTLETFGFPISHISRQPVKIVTKTTTKKQPSTTNTHNFKEQDDHYNAASTKNHLVDHEAIKTWVYPTNYPVRDYQFDIVQKSLNENVLVALPTGLGKTFIAAVVMYNFYRFFPDGKIVFMAPTKPLVAQQIDAIFKITGIPEDDTIELTGQTCPENRVSAWNTKRVFFLTPQVMHNDLRLNVCPAEGICLLVVDEAHRATGNYAYCEIIRKLMSTGETFRVLALTATPGANLKDVQEVVTNLNISKIELRTEDDEDIRKNTFGKILDTIVVQLDTNIIKIQTEFAQIISVHLEKLIQKNVYYSRDPLAVSHYQLLMAAQTFRQQKGNMPRSTAIFIESEFAITMFLAQALSLLINHGIKSFYQKLSSYVNERNESGNLIPNRGILRNNPTFEKMMHMIDEMIVDPTFCSHPKLDRLVATVVKHFYDYQEQNEIAVAHGAEKIETRIMIFSQYRDSVEEISAALSQHKPLIKPMTFVGQSSKFTQKDQLNVIQQFQSGSYNTLVATCIGEEGLDIGDVDLIICYDSQNSPIRMLQRMGRTGRKRDGRVVVLLTAGKEEESFKKAQSQYLSVQKVIKEQQGKKLQMYPSKFARMLPPGVIPECVKKNIVVPTRSNNLKSVTSRKKTSASSTSAKIIGSNTMKASSGAFLNERETVELNEMFPEYPGLNVLSLYPALHMHSQSHLSLIESDRRNTRSTHSRLLGFGLNVIKKLELSEDGLANLSDGFDFGSAKTVKKKVPQKKRKVDTIRKVKFDDSDDDMDILLLSKKSKVTQVAEDSSIPSRKKPKGEPISELFALSDGGLSDDSDKSFLNEIVSDIPQQKHPTESSHQNMLSSKIREESPTASFDNPPLIKKYVPLNPTRAISCISPDLKQEPSLHDPMDDADAFMVDGDFFNDISMDGAPSSPSSPILINSSPNIQKGTIVIESPKPQHFAHKRRLIDQTPLLKNDRKPQIPVNIEMKNRLMDTPLLSNDNKQHIFHNVEKKRRILEDTPLLSSNNSIIPVDVEIMHDTPLKNSNAPLSSAEKLEKSYPCSTIDRVFRTTGIPELSCAHVPDNLYFGMKPLEFLKTLNAKPKEEYTQKEEVFKKKLEGFLIEKRKSMTLLKQNEDTMCVDQNGTFNLQNSDTLYNDLEDIDALLDGMKETDWMNLEDLSFEEPIEPLSQSLEKCDISSPVKSAVYIPDTPSINRIDTKKTSPYFKPADTLPKHTSQPSDNPKLSTKKVHTPKIANCNNTSLPVFAHPSTSTLKGITTTPKIPSTGSGTKNLLLPHEVVSLDTRCVQSKFFTPESSQEIAVKKKKHQRILTDSSIKPAKTRNISVESVSVDHNTNNNTRQTPLSNPLAKFLFNSKEPSKSSVQQEPEQVSDSSSTDSFQVDAEAANRLRQRMANKKQPRRAPRARHTPQLFNKKEKKRDVLVKKKKRPKLKMSENKALFDVDAGECSSDGEGGKITNKAYLEESDFENDKSLDQDLDSFIVDDSFSQTQAPERRVDMRQVYLQSILSPIDDASKYRVVGGKRRRSLNLNKFNDTFDDDDEALEEYQRDSELSGFVVGDYSVEMEDEEGEQSQSSCSEDVGCSFGIEDLLK